MIHGFVSIYCLDAHDTDADLNIAVGSMASLLIDYSNMSSPAFMSFIDPSNVPSQLIMAHKNALWLFYIHATNGEWIADRNKSQHLPALTNAIINIKESLEPDMQHYVGWPIEIRRRALTAPKRWPYWTGDM
jgi:hypothetical protein